MKNQYNKTMTACFVGYIVQAIIVNFVPLLFLTFQRQYHLPLSQITMLITFNFGVQLLVDMAAIGFVDKLGYRFCMILAHILSACGLISLTFLPEMLPSAFAGILISVMIYAVGGGLLEVLVSPVVEACPSDNKEKAMSLLHSFYCWGQVGVVMMVCAGASEQAVSQWVSTFAEKGLGISKAAGDLAGPMAFALCMGLSRMFYGKYGEKIRLDYFMKGSCIFCIISYLGISLFPNPILSLFACAVSGFSVGIMWPGTFSKAAAALPKAGTALFALLALGGDFGCSAGPTLVGFVSDLAGDNLKLGILASVVFPVLLLVGLAICRKTEGNIGGENERVF